MPPALRTPSASSGGEPRVMSPTGQAERASPAAADDASTTSPAVTTPKVGAEARSEEAKEAAKAQLMDVLDGKMRCATLSSSSRVRGNLCFVREGLGGRGGGQGSSLGKVAEVCCVFAMASEFTSFAVLEHEKVRVASWALSRRARVWCWTVAGSVRDRLLAPVCITLCEKSEGISHRPPLRRVAFMCDDT